MREWRKTSPPTRMAEAPVAVSPFVSRAEVAAAGQDPADPKMPGGLL